MARIIASIQRRWGADGGYRQVLALAVPLILSTGSWSLQSFINRMFLAWHSPDSLAAAMPAGMLNFAIMSVFLNTAGYVSVFAAQHHGAGQDGRVGRTMWQAAGVAVIAGALNLALIPLTPAFFRWVGHDAGVQANEVMLFRILCLGAFPAVMGSALSGMLSGLGRTRAVMWVTLAGTGVNILCDYLLIFGHWGCPALGIAGAGWSSVIAAAVQLAVFAAIAARPAFRARFRTADWRPDGKIFWSLIKYGLPNGVQNFIDMAGFAVFVLLVGRIGRNELAATNLAFNINTLAFMPMIGIGIAVAVMVGQALGRNDPARARYSVRSAFDLTFAYMAAVAALFFALPQLFLAPFRAQSDPASFAAIGAITAVLLRFVAIYTLFDAFNIIFSSAIKGAGDTKFVMYMIIALSLGVLIGPSFVAITRLHASIYACWAIASAYVAALGVAFYLRYRGGQWQAMRVIECPAPALVHRPESPPVEC
ncbi:MAG TPA: MATE family efflux transporter [Candidatus Edwardsbacteria bacterium]|nr:MATE family efflux transporter [Candidatus Edwardsbacteria bacterium]